MVLYINGAVNKVNDRYQAEGIWIAEADLRSNPKLKFELASVNKTPDVLEREEVNWARLKAKDPSLFDGPLIRIKYLLARDGWVVVGISKSGYKEHHASFAPGGKRDCYTEKFFPYGFRIENGVAVPEIPNSENFYSAFAGCAIVEAADKKLVFGIRSSTVDQFKGIPSLPSGGRFNGKPHEMVDELVTDTDSIYNHFDGMLELEYPGLERQLILEKKLTGITRSLTDLDVTISAHTKIDVLSTELEKKLDRKKYKELGSVAANADGIFELLELGFPSTIQPVIVYSAGYYGIEEKDLLRKMPGSKRLE